MEFTNESYSELRQSISEEIEKFASTNNYDIDIYDVDNLISDISIEIVKKDLTDEESISKLINIEVSKICCRDWKKQGEINEFIFNVVHPSSEAENTLNVCQEFSKNLTPTEKIWLAAKIDRQTSKDIKKFLGISLYHRKQVKRKYISYLNNEHSFKLL